MARRPGGLAVLLFPTPFTPEDVLASSGFGIANLSWTVSLCPPVAASFGLVLLLLCFLTVGRPLSSSALGSDYFLRGSGRLCLPSGSPCAGCSFEGCSFRNFDGFVKTACAPSSL